MRFIVARHAILDPMGIMGMGVVGVEAAISQDGADTVGLDWLGLRLLRRN